MVRQGDAKKCVYMGLLRPGRVTASCSPVCAVAGVRPVCIKWERSRVRRCECPSTASSTTFTTQASAGRTTRGTSALQRRVVPATARRYIASPCCVVTLGKLFTPKPASLHHFSVLQPCCVVTLGKLFTPKPASLHRFSVLQPCAIDGFNGAEFVCCPAQGNWPTQLTRTWFART